MAKLIKWLFFSLIALLLLLVIAGIVATRSIDPQTVKNLVEEQTQQATSLNMNFKGELDWSFFPGIRLGVSDIELHTQKSYDGDTLFAEVGQASSAISLMKLLAGNVSIDKLELADIKLRMVTDRRGHSNWKDVEPTTTNEAQTAGEDIEESESSTASISFGNVSLSNINMSLIDLKAGTRQVVLVKNMEGKNINFSGDSFSLQSSIALTSDASANPIEIQFASPFRFDAEAEKFFIEKISGKLDQTAFSGSGALAFGKDTKFTADLSLGTFDMNRYISNSTETENPGSNDGSASVSEDIELPLDTLHTLNTQLKLSIAKLIYQKTELDDLQIQLSVDNGVLNVKKLDASVYGGSISQSFSVDANRKPAQLKATQRLSNIDLKSLFASNDFEVGLEGKASIETNVSARGNSANALKRTLTGQTSAKLADGRYLDDNIEQRICQSIALARQTALTRSWSSGTSLEDVDVAINWNNGIGNIQSFSAGLANAHVNGDGSINIVDTSYDLRLLANVSGDLTTATAEGSDVSESGCEINEQYRDIAWPIRCQGNAQENSCGVDNSRLDKILSNLARSKAKAAVDKELDKQRNKLQEKLNDKLGEGVGDALRGLFK